MNLKVKFEEQDQHFRADFGEVHVVNDGGFERGLAEGKAEVLNKRTDLVVTANGEYTPTDDSTGFKSVSVNVASKLVQAADRSITELTEEDLQGATKIGKYAFRYCSELKTARIPEGVTHLQDYSFSNTGLVEIILPSTITKIDNAFSSARFIETFVVKAKTPPTLASGALVAFDCPVTVPVGSGDLYKSATNWSADADRIVEGDV